LGLHNGASASPFPATTLMPRPDADAAGPGSTAPASTRPLARRRDVVDRSRLLRLAASLDSACPCDFPGLALAPRACGRAAARSGPRTAPGPAFPEPQPTESPACRLKISVARASGRGRAGPLETASARDRFEFWMFRVDRRPGSGTVPGPDDWAVLGGKKSLPARRQPAMRRHDWYHSHRPGTARVCCRNWSRAARAWIASTSASAGYISARLGLAIPVGAAATVLAVWARRDARAERLVHHCRAGPGHWTGNPRPPRPSPDVRGPGSDRR